MMGQCNQSVLVSLALASALSEYLVTLQSCMCNKYMDEHHPRVFKVAETYHAAIQVTKRMMGAFEGRCQTLYGKAGGAPAATVAKAKKYQVA